MTYHAMTRRRDNAMTRWRFFVSSGFSRSFVTLARRGVTPSSSPWRPATRWPSSRVSWSATPLTSRCLRRSDGSVKFILIIIIISVGTIDDWLKLHSINDRLCTANNRSLKTKISLKKKWITRIFITLYNSNYYFELPCLTFENHKAEHYRFFQLLFDDWFKFVFNYFNHQTWKQIQFPTLIIIIISYDHYGTLALNTNLSALFIFKNQWKMRNLGIILRGTDSTISATAS